MSDCLLYKSLENECCCICANRVPLQTMKNEPVGFACLLEFFVDPDDGIGRFWQSGHGNCEFFINRNENRIEGTTE